MIYRRRTSTRWLLMQTLQAPSPYNGDSFGSQVAVYGGWLVVAAPEYDSTGMVFGFILDSNVPIYNPVMSVRPVDPLAVSYGTTLYLTDSFLLSAAPSVSTASGALGLVYSYNAYLFFPIKAPTYWVTADPKYNRVEMFVRTGQAFLVNETLTLQVRCRFHREVCVMVPSASTCFQHCDCCDEIVLTTLSLPVASCCAFQVSIATWDDTDPQPIYGQATRDLTTGEIAPGGGWISIPPVAGVYTLRGISYYQPEDISSDTAIIKVNVSVRE